MDKIPLKPYWKLELLCASLWAAAAGGMFLFIPKVRSALDSFGSGLPWLTRFAVWIHPLYALLYVLALAAFVLIALEGWQPDAPASIWFRKLCLRLVERLPGQGFILDHKALALWLLAAGAILALAAFFGCLLLPQYVDGGALSDR
ncbi:MAG: hypothetical protein WC881_06125 [Elusimicrobiota bacterium]|jgi:type II secretory pathway component PulF